MCLNAKCSRFEFAAKWIFDGDPSPSQQFTQAGKIKRPKNNNCLQAPGRNVAGPMITKTRRHFLSTTPISNII